MPFFKVTYSERYAVNILIEAEDEETAEMVGMGEANGRYIEISRFVVGCEEVDTEEVTKDEWDKAAAEFPIGVIDEFYE